MFNTAPNKSDWIALVSWTGRGVAWLVVLLSAAGGAYWPLATSPCPFLEPFPSTGGAHRLFTALCAPSPCLTYAYPLLTLPFSW